MAVDRVLFDLALTITDAALQQAYRALEPLNLGLLADGMEEALPDVTDPVEREILSESIRVLRAGASFVSEIDDVEVVFKTMGLV